MLPHIWDATIFPKKHNTHPRVNRVVKGITKSVFAPFSHTSFGHYIRLQRLSDVMGDLCGLSSFPGFSPLQPWLEITHLSEQMCSPTAHDLQIVHSTFSVFVRSFDWFGVVNSHKLSQDVPKYNTSLNSTPKLSFKESLAFGPQNIKFL